MPVLKAPKDVDKSVMVCCDADVIARHVTGCTVVIEQASRDLGGGVRFKLDFYNLMTPSGRAALAQSESAESLKAWAYSHNAKRVEVL